MEPNYKKAKSILEEYSQEHLIAQYGKLDDIKKQKILNQIFNIDFEKINKLYEQTKITSNTSNDKIEPIDYINKENIITEEKEKYTKIGVEELKNNKLAVVTMAGGQGTRLRA